MKHVKTLLVTCDFCKKEFVIEGYALKTQKHHFCSRECYQAWQRNWFKENKKPPKKVKVKCGCCGKETGKYPSQIASYNHHFCSNECKNRWANGRQVCSTLEKRIYNKPPLVLHGSKNPNWKGGKVQVRCDYCDSILWKHKCRVGKHNFCSFFCQMKWMRKQGLFSQKKTTPERIFEDICLKYTLPFKYVGDGSFWIHNINPDFVEVNGKKMAVEIFGDYWHSPLLRGNIPYNQTYGGRKKTLKKYGWKLVVLWEKDLRRKDAEAFVFHILEEGGYI